MTHPLRIAVFVGSFPVVSETFILRQITGLLDLGQQVDIFSDTRAEPGAPAHPEVSRYRLLERATFMDMPPASAPWEMPIKPLTGRTWVPGSATSILNFRRLLRAAPKFFRCLLRTPALTRRVLDSAEYGYQAASLSSLYRLDKLASRRGRYDVLHAHFGPVGNSFRFARQLWRAPMLVSFHGYDFSTLPRQQGKGMYRRLFETADQFTANSDFTRRQLERLGCPAQKLRLLPVGLNPDESTFRERNWRPGEPLRILAVGRLVEIKGHEHLIRAMAKLRARVPEARCDIAGDGPLRPKLEALAGELGLAGAIPFHGALDGPAVRRLMDAAHLFVLASVSVDGDQEGQGLVLQEAQACGLPVLATRHGALPEGLLDGETGFLVPERDAEALADRLCFLAANPERWPEWGRRGREFVVERYDIRRLNRRLLELYAEAIAGFAPGQ